MKNDSNDTCENDPRTGILNILVSQTCDLESGDLVLIMIDNDFEFRTLGMVALKIKNSNNGFYYMIIRSNSDGSILYEKYARGSLHKFDPYRIK